MKCQQCGALLDPSAIACPYCNAPTPAAAVARAQQEQKAQARAQWEAAAQYQQNVATTARMTAAGKQSVLFGALGVVICCAPLSIAGLVQAVRSRSLAASIHQPAPTNAKVGLALNLLAIVASVSFYTWAFVSDGQAEKANDQAVAALEAQVAASSKAATLDHATACKLAELKARRDGWAGNRGHVLEGFECVGKSDATATKGQLDDFRFGHIKDRYEVNVCFKRGAQWYVTEMRTGPCP